jgi:hypothetical protein
MLQLCKDISEYIPKINSRHFWLLCKHRPQRHQRCVRVTGRPPRARNTTQPPITPHSFPTPIVTTTLLFRPTMGKGNAHGSKHPAHPAIDAIGGGGTGLMGGGEGNSILSRPPNTKMSIYYVFILMEKVVAKGFGHTSRAQALVRLSAMGVPTRSATPGRSGSRALGIDWMTPSHMNPPFTVTQPHLNTHY